ncbi:MAG: oligosaccharide flippase family protein [Bacteroidota bacterium]|nr:oligosaccharide flippase family protein [Candidatus Kapabacteria bacterium]MDW8219357.1 oligosaccharide flippase family protein [Bacteroidota bacterium]
MVRIQDHIAKIAWTLADKVLLLCYGFVNIMQNNALPPHELGLYTLCNALHTFIFALSDGFVLQSIIVKGAHKELRGSVTRFAVFWHIALVMGISGGIFSFQEAFAWFLREPRLKLVAAYLPLLCFLALPRTLCLKYLIRDVQMREVFVVNVAWIGSMTGVTIWLLVHHALVSFEAMAIIAASGMGTSSIVALWITRRQIFFATVERIHPREFWSIGMYQGTAALLGNLIRQLDVAGIQYFFGAATVGVYQAAKTLFRFFDEAFNAIISLVYPATMRFVYEKRFEELRSMLSKMLSFSLAAILVIVAVAQAGGAEYAISHLLSRKYAAAVGYFCLLLWAAPAMPCVALSPVMVAFGEMRRFLLYIVGAMIVGMTMLATIGILHMEALVPLGIVAYTVVLGIWIFAAVQSYLHIPMRMLFRVIPDTMHFLRRWLKKP